MQIETKDEMETLTLRDIDIAFGPGETLTLTLYPGDEIAFPEPLANGDIRVRYQRGEDARINGQLVKWYSDRQRTITRKKHAAQPAASDRE
jgi:hypothetical protein